MRNSRLPQPRERDPINSSLAIVNIVLLLVFFFLATGSISGSQQVTVTLPDTTELPLDLLPKPLLEITAEGEMRLDGEPVALGGLSEALGDNPSLHIMADREGNAGTLLDILAGEALLAVEVRLVTIHRKLTSETAQP